MNKTRYSDEEYIGDRNAQGWSWNGDLECYENPENWTPIKVTEKDGWYRMTYILLGKWTHEVQVKDLDTLDGLTDEEEQSVFKDWYHNRKATGMAASDKERWIRENT